MMLTIFPLGEVLFGASSAGRKRIGGLVGILVLLIFVAVGIDMVIHPKRHMSLYLRRGGEMLREWNELQVQLVGVLFTCGSGWILCQVIWGGWLDWSR
jgi:hypothetical protein